MKNIGSLIVLILVASIYIQMDDVRIRVDDYKTTFYVYENRWLVSGVEENKLFKGTRLQYRDAKNIERTDLFGVTNITLIRDTPYKNDATIINTYKFDGTITDVEHFPVSHTIEIFNAEGYIYQYEVKRLKCDYDTVKGVDSPQSFGRDMKIEWDGEPYYTKIYRYKGIDECKLTLKYRIDSNYVKLNIRLFDPPDTLTFDYNNIDMYHACSYYTITNKGNKVGKDKSDLVKSLKISNKNTDGYKNGKKEIIGTIKNDKWEYQYNHTYNVTVNDYKTVTEMGTCYEDNKSYDCEQNVTKLIGNHSEERWNLAWTKDTTKVKFKDKKSLVRYCADITRVWTNNGYEVLVDHEPTYSGKAYPEYTWWDGSWTHKRPINITVATDVTDYQLKINITDNTHFLSNWSDMRFVDSTEAIELSYWIEEKSDGNWASVWIKGNFTNTTAPYVYYGNTGATDNSNGDNTFIFFDDFSEAGMNTTKWSKTAGATVTQTAGIMTIDAVDANWYYIKSQTTFDDNITVTANQSCEYGGTGAHHIITGVRNFTDNHRICYYKVNADKKASYWDGSWHHQTITWTPSNWNYHEIKKRSGTSEFILNGASVKNYSYYLSDTAVHFNRADNDIYLDYVHVRKNTGAVWEPTYVIGAEESGSDTTKPTYSDNSTNSTLADTEILHSLKWEDDIGLDSYIFSFDNCTGSFVNDSAVSFSGIPNWSNVSKSVNDTVGCIIRWQIYANDTSNNWNVSEIYSYVTTEEPILFTVTLNSPANETETNDNTPDFNFTVSGSASTYSCELFIAVPTWCYQETANESTACGGLDTGEYTSGINPNFYDGDWNTYSSNQDFYVNYTLPDNIIKTNNNLLKYKKNSFDATENTSTVSGCLSQTPLNLFFDYKTTPSVFYAISCYNYESSSYVYLTYDANLNIYEEAMWWNVSSYVSYGTNATVINNTATTITPTALDDGTYDWYVNCTANSVTNNSEVREITIDKFNVTSCATLDVENGVYTLKANLSSAGTCLTIGANNITVDGNGYTINYSQSSTGYGINNTGDNVTIKNCNIVQGSIISGAVYPHAIINARNIVEQDNPNYVKIHDNNITTSNYGTACIVLYSKEWTCYNAGTPYDLCNNSLVYNNNVHVKNDSITIASQGSHDVIYNNNATSDAGSSGGGFKIDAVCTHIYDNYLYGDMAYGIKIMDNYNVLENNNITITGVGLYGIRIHASVTGNNITNGSISSVNSQAYRLASSGLNIFKDTNFTERLVLFYSSNNTRFSFTNTADESILLDTKLIFSGTYKATKRKLAEWSSIKISWNESNQSESMSGYYSLTNLISSQEYNVTNTTIEGTTTSLINSDASGNLDFQIPLDDTTTITVMPTQNVTLYINSSSANRYFEITDDLNISAYSTTAGGTMCISIDNPLFGDNYSCSSDSYSALLEIIPAIDTFNDSSSTKTITSDDAVYFTLNNHSEIQTAYINISSLATNLSFGINSFEHNILGKITGTTANVSTVDYMTTRNLTFMGASSNVVYIDLPSSVTISSAKFNISSGGETITQNLLDDTYENKSYTVTAGDNFTFYVTVPLSSTIDSVKFNISAESYTYTLGTPDTISCSGENVVNCDKAFGTDSDYAQSSDNTDSSTSLTVDAEWCIQNITNVTSSFYNFGSCSYDGLTNIWLNRHLYIYNYGSSTWGSSYRYDSSWKISSSHFVFFGGSYSVDNPISTNNLKLRTTTTATTGTSICSSHYARQYYGHISATKTLANATIDMLNDGNDDNIEVIATPTTVELNKTLLQSYLDTCTEDPCQIYFTVNSSHDSNDRTFEIDAIRLVYSNNPKNITIDTGDDGHDDYSYLNDLNSTHSPQQVDLNVTAINNYLSSCSGICSVPILVASKQGGNMSIDTIEILYNFNPFPINITAGNNYLYSYNGDVDIPINFSATSWGQTNISNLNVSFYGDANFTITANYSGSTILSASDTIDVYLVWSNYSKTYPTGVSFFRFFPDSTDDQNVTPYGQKTAVPFYNITGLQKDKPFNFYMKTDAFVTPINLTVSNTSTKSSLKLNTTWQKVLETVNNSDVGQLWFWLDLFDVNATEFRFEKFNIYMQAICTDCVI